MAETSVRITRQGGNFVLIERRKGGNEECGRVVISGGVSGLREMAEFLSETAEAFDIVGNLDI